MDYKENNKNYDPRMHTTEHILNSTMDKMFGCGRAFSAHIEKKKSKCDYRFDRNLTEEEIGIIEAKVNEVIKMNLDVKEEFMNKEEAGKYFNLSRLPDDAGDNLRVIKVGDYDQCLCSGVHINNTSEVGADFKIISTSCENGVMRLRFKLV